MEITWIVVANSSLARLFTTESPFHDYRLLRQWHHPQSRERERDLTTDHASHHETRHSERPADRSYGSYPEPTDPKQYEATRFAADLGADINHAYHQQKFQSLLLVAPPHFLGLLRPQLAPIPAAVLHPPLAKDYTLLPERQLAPLLRSQLQAGGHTTPAQA